MQDIKTAGHQPGNPVVLAACNTGKKKFREKLSKVLDSPVYGPDKYGYNGGRPDPNGRNSIWEPNHIGSMDGRNVSEGYRPMPNEAIVGAFVWHTDSPGTIQSSDPSYYSHNPTNATSNGGYWRVSWTPGKFFNFGTWRKQ